MNVEAALEAFELATGVSVANVLSRRGSDSTAPISDRLRSLILDPDLRQVAWWADVASAWSAAGFAEISQVCCERARALVDEGESAEWHHLRTLADLWMNGPTQEVRGPGRTAGQRSRIQAEGRQKRLNRLRLLFGRGNASARQKALQRLWDREEFESVLCSATNDEDIETGLMQACWLELGSNQAAVEELLARARRPFASWHAGFSQSLGHAARAFNRLGDRVTAYACCRLALWLAGASEAESPKPGQLEDLAVRLARREIEGLAWAEERLDSHRYLARLSPLGNQVGRAFVKRGLAGKYLDYLRRSQALAQWYGSRVLSRQLRLIAAEAGWVIPTWRPIVEGAGTQATELPRMDRNRPLLVAWRRRQQSEKHRQVIKPRRPPLGVVLGRLRPRSLGPLEAWSGHATAARLPIGYSARTISGRRDIPISPGRPVLVVSQHAADALSTRWLRSIADGHRQVLGIGLPPTESVVLDKDSSFVEISTDEEHVEPGMHCNVRLWAGSAAVQLTVKELVDDLIGNTDDPLAGASLDRLASRLGEEKEWALWLLGECRGHPSLAWRCVADAGFPVVRRVKDLRRAAFLVNRLCRVEKALRQALSVSWIESPKANAGRSRPRAALIEVDERRRLDHALRATLCVCSLLMTARAAALEIEGAEVLDWPLNPRRSRLLRGQARTGGSASAPPPAEPTREPVAADEVFLRSNDFFASNRWLERGFVKRGESNEYCVLVGPEAASCCFPIARWFRKGMVGESHALVVVLRSIPWEWVSGSALKQFRTIVLGASSEAEGRKLEVAAGLLQHASIERLGNGGVDVYSMDDGKLDHFQAVLWG